MNATTQKPNAADGDARGQVLGFNRINKAWFVVSWSQIDGGVAGNWTDWQTLPPAPPVVPAPPKPKGQHQQNVAAPQPKQEVVETVSQPK